MDSSMESNGATGSNHAASDAANGATKSSVTKSPEYQNFESLLRAVVSVPHAELQRRLEAEKTAKEWGRENAQAARRARPIVSPAAVASHKTRKRNQFDVDSSSVVAASRPGD